MAKCKKGKSCGSSCIASIKTCRIQLSPKLSEGIALLRQKIQSGPSEFFKVSGSLDAEEINWKAIESDNAKELGKGARGTVYMVSESDLIPGGDPKKKVAVKSGRLGDYEIEMMEELSRLDVAPKFLGAQVMRGDRFSGRVAMSVVPGPTMYMAPEQTNGIPKSDSFIKAMATIHRAGIAHGDPHILNIMIGPDGKGRWVDLGDATRDNKKIVYEMWNHIPTEPKSKLEKRVFENYEKWKKKVVKREKNPETAQGLKEKLDDTMGSLGTLQKLLADPKETQSFIRDLYEGVD